jgi:hypothetical protein
MSSRKGFVAAALTARSLLTPGALGGPGCTGTSTPVLKPGASATITVDLTSPGTYEYLSSVADDAFAGMKGELEVT